MLKIIYGDINKFDNNLLSNFIFNIDIWFDYNYEKDWLNNELVKRMILDIDKSEHIKDHVIESPVLGAITPRMLSGGVKLLIGLYNKPNLIQWATNCGDNCAKWILEISRQKDITINLEHIMKFDKYESNFEALILNTNKLYINGEDLMNAIIDEEYKVLIDD